MAKRLLFLLGGGEIAYEAVADVFIPAADGAAAIIALLMQGSPEWQTRFLPRYLPAWQRHDVGDVRPVVPAADGKLDIEAALATLRAATGIFIGGGHTATYHRLFATEPVRTAIRERYAAGVPVAGISAGALLLPAITLLSPGESYGGGLEIVPGLGLLPDTLVGVHFTEWGRQPDLCRAMQQTRTTAAWGLDEPVCALFTDERYTRTIGRDGHVYHISMGNFETGACTITLMAE